MPSSTPFLFPLLAPFLASLLSIAAAAFTLGAVCDGAATGDDAGLRQVRGQIIEVAARSIGEVETLRLRESRSQPGPSARWRRCVCGTTMGGSMSSPRRGSLGSRRPTCWNTDCWASRFWSPTARKTDG